jgi:hypothetical protein
MFALEDFGGDLGLEIEAVRFDLEIFDYISAEDLVTACISKTIRIIYSPDASRWWLSVGSKFRGREAIDP